MQSTRDPALRGWNPTAGGGVVIRGSPREILSQVVYIIGHRKCYGSNQSVFERFLRDLHDFGRGGEASCMKSFHV